MHARLHSLVLRLLQAPSHAALALGAMWAGHRLVGGLAPAMWLTTAWTVVAAVVVLRRKDSR